MILIEFYLISRRLKKIVIDMVLKQVILVEDDEVGEWKHASIFDKEIFSKILFNFSIDLC